MAVTRVYTFSGSEGDASQTSGNFTLIAGRDLVIYSTGTGYSNDVTVSDLAGTSLTQFTPNDSLYAANGIRQRVWYGFPSANYTDNNVTTSVDLGGNPHTLNVAVYRCDAGKTWALDTSAFSVSTTPYVAPTIDTVDEGVAVLFYSEQFNSTAVTPTIGGTEYTLQAHAFVTLQAAGVFDRLRTSSEAGIGGDTVTATDGRGMLYAVSFKTASLTPVFSGQPQSQTIADGQTATLTASVSGADTLQWEDNRSGSFAAVTDGTGGTTATYTTAALGLAASGRQYRLVATNASGSATSSPATVTVSTTGAGRLGHFDPELRIEGWF